MNILSSFDQFENDKLLTERQLQDYQSIINGDWRKFVDCKKEDDFRQIVIEENPDEQKARKFITEALESGDFKTNGTVIDSFMPPVRRFGGGGDRAAIKQRIIDRLMEFYERYFGM